MKNKKLTLLDWKSYRYFFLRLVRQRQTPQNLAFSVALGVYIGCQIPVFQMPIALALALLFRANKIVSVACVWYSNPLTIPPLFALNLYIGSRFIAKENRTMINSILENWRSLDTWLNIDWLKFGQSGIASFAIGGFITGIISSVIFYFISFILVRTMRRQKEQRLKKRQNLLQREYKLHEIHHKKNDSGSHQN